MSSNAKNKWTTKKILLYGWIDLIAFCVVLAFAILIVNLFLNGHMVTTPWPNELSPLDIKNGDGIILAYYWSFSILLLCFLSIHLVFSILICHAILVNAKLRQTNAATKFVWWKQIGYYVGIFVGVLIPLVLPIYFIRRGYFLPDDEQDETELQQRKRFLPALWQWVNSSLMVLAANSAALVLIIGTTFWVETKPYYNANNCKKFYELSNNHNNLLYLYFDRTDSWRVSDEIKNLDDTRRDAFRDFTFYSNSISLSDTTVASVPYLSFGYNANILDKTKISKPIIELSVNSLDGSNTNVTFPGSCNKTLDEMTLQEFYKFSFANFIAFWNYLGYGINNVCNYPYYGNQSLLLFSPNNSRQMNNEMRHEFAFKNFSGTNSNELQTYQKRKVHYNNIDDAYVVGNLKHELKFVPTQSGVFSAFYSQQNHWDFAVRHEENNYRHLHGNNSKNLHRSIRDSLIDLSEFINWFKREHTKIYDKTTIVITSDHGHCFENEPQEPSSVKRAAGFAPVFMVKPMHAQPSTSGDEPFHVNSSLVTTADQLALLRNLIYPDWTPDLLNDPWNPKIRFKLTNQEFSNFTCYQTNFKNNDENSWNREISVMHPHDWRYAHWRKQIQMSRTRKFKLNETADGTKSVFAQHNWSEFSDELNND